MQISYYMLYEQSIKQCIINNWDCNQRNHKTEMEWEYSTSYIKKYVECKKQTTKANKQQKQTNKNIP